MTTQLASVPRVQDTSRLTIRPGHTARLVMTAHCADKTLPAFVNNHLLTLRPASQFVSNDRWGSMQMSLLRYFAANPGLVRPSDQQLMLWGLQGKEENGSPFYFQALMRRNDLLEVLEQAHPGARAEIQRAQAMDEVNRQIRQLVQRNLPPEARQLLGHAGIVDILANPQDAPRFIEQELERMAAMQPAPSRTPAPGPDAAFSTLASNVYAHSIGSGRLTATTTITNMGSEPFVFVPSEWVLETKTEHQRGILTGFSRVQVFDHRAAQAWYAADTVASISQLAGRMQRLAMGGLNMRPGNRVYDRMMSASRTLRNSQFSRLLNNPAARSVAPYLPLIGNIKSAFDVLNPNNSNTERVLAAFGVVPGVGSLVKIAGGASRLPAVAQWAINNGGTRYLASASQRTDVLREIHAAYSLSNGAFNLPDEGQLWQASYSWLRRSVASHLQVPSA